MLVFHNDRASAFIRQIMHAYDEQTHLYAHTHHERDDAPQRRFIPDGVRQGSLHHRRYLFGTTLGDSIEEIVTYCRRYERKHKRKFLPGYGPKILSLLAIHFYDFGVHATMFPGAFPVDRHIQRQLLGCGVVELSAEEEEVDAARAIAESIRPKLITLCEQQNVSVFNLAHAMWFLGNKLCYQCRSLMEQGRESKLAFCPMLTMCTGARETRTYQERGKWRVSTEPEPTDPSPQQDLFD